MGFLVGEGTAAAFAGGAKTCVLEVLGRMGDTGGVKLLVLGLPWSSGEKIVSPSSSSLGVLSVDEVGEGLPCVEVGERYVVERGEAVGEDCVELVGDLY